MMTKKNYQDAATRIQNAPMSIEAKRECASIFADFFFSDNPRFDRMRFMVACGIVVAPKKKK